MLVSIIQSTEKANLRIAGPKVVTRLSANWCRRSAGADSLEKNVSSELLVSRRHQHAVKLGIACRSCSDSRNRVAIHHDCDQALLE